MKLRKLAILSSLLALAAGSILLVAQTASAAPGGPPPRPDDLVIGPGALVYADRDQSDSTSSEKKDPDQGNEDAADRAGPDGLVFNLGLKARRVDQSLITRLGGPRLSLCSVRGPGAYVDFVSEGGNTPMQSVQCGRAFGMDIDLDRCQANLEFHGFTHSDRFGDIYLGMMTTDVSFRKTGANTGDIRFTVYTPKTRIIVSGRVVSPTPIVMTTCP